MYATEMDRYKAETGRMCAEGSHANAAATLELAAAQDRLRLAMNAPAVFDPIGTAVRIAAELAAHTPMTPDQIAKRARDVSTQLGQEFA
jgi:hypothetical protein